MKFNFFNLFRKSKTSNQKEEIEQYGLTKSELAEYDYHANFYYTNIINAIILFTYNSEQLDRMSPVLIDPITELYEELDYAFTPVMFETVFRQNLIDLKFKNELLNFKYRVDQIPKEIWNWEQIDIHESWKELRNHSEIMLVNMGIASRIYDNSFTTIHIITDK